jgi:hypothetical protein
MYEYWINGADGSKFKVGSDCVQKTGGHSQVAGFQTVKKDHLAQQRSAKRKALWEAKQVQWAAEAAAKKLAFDAENPGLYDAMKAMKGDFFASLVKGVDKYGALTERQLEVVKRILAENQQKAELVASSQFVGKAKEKVSGQFQIMLVKSWQANFYPYPMSYFHVLAMGGNVFTYKGSTWLGNSGETVNATFSIKGHTIYEGTQQTELARPKDVAAVPKVEAA